MTVRLDRRRFESLMSAKKLGMTGLAERASLSRQGVYRMLRDDYRPLSRGFESIAAVLGVSALDLLDTEDELESPLGDLASLVGRARDGSARAFELAPWQLARFDDPREVLEMDLTPREWQLVAAASDLAVELTGREEIAGLSAAASRRFPPGDAFFFGASMMSPDRIVSSTPEPMRLRLVFGAFSMEDFGRHFR